MCAYRVAVRNNPLFFILMQMLDVSNKMIRHTPIIYYNNDVVESLFPLKFGEDREKMGLFGYGD